MTLKTSPSWLYDYESVWDDTENISIMTGWVSTSMTLKTSALWLYESVRHWKHQHYDYMSQYEYDTENISVMTVRVSMTLKTSALWQYESTVCYAENIRIMTVWLWLYESIWVRQLTLKTSVLWLYESVWCWKHQHYDCMSPYDYDTENISIMTV